LFQDKCNLSYKPGHNIFISLYEILVETVSCREENVVVPHSQYILWGNYNSA